MFKVGSADSVEQLRNLTMFELQAIQNIFVMKKIDILGFNELNRKEKPKNRTQSAFEAKPLNERSPRSSSTYAKERVETLDSGQGETPLMEMPDRVKVGDIFNYRKNQVKVVCTFQTLLELFQEQVTVRQLEMQEHASRDQVRMSDPLLPKDQSAATNTQDTTNNTEGVSPLLPTE